MGSKISVVILYNYFYPAYKAGGPIQSLVNLVDILKDELNIEVICSNADLDRTILSIDANKWVNKSGRTVYYNGDGFKNMKRHLKKDSLVYINGMYSIQYNFLPALKFSNRKIVSARGMLHANALSQKRLKKQLYLALWKLLKLHKKCEFHATTEQEKQDIEAVFGSKVKVWVIQNLPATMNRLAPAIKKPGELHIATIALISAMKNHVQVIKSLSHCRETIVYHIYGPIKDKKYWDTCKSILDQLPDNIKVNYHGDVSPGKIPGILKDIHVYVQPSKSENFGHSLYEALASGRPVITSFNTPWNELAEAKAGVNVDPHNISALSAAISNFAQMTQEELDSWSAAAAEYSTKAVNIAEIKNQYIQMFTNQSN
jgi:glycosyltransferase involved in cell wall biosynthesis